MTNIPIFHSQIQNITIFMIHDKYSDLSHPDPKHYDLSHPDPKHYDLSQPDPKHSDLYDS